MAEKATLTSHWPALPLDAWDETYCSVHLWTQIIGKIKLKLTPLINHWWNVALQISSSGLTTGIIHYANGCFQIDFDFIQHQMFIKTDDGKTESVQLGTRSVADFYQETMTKLNSLGIKVQIWTKPVEMDYKVHFENDHTIRKYNPEFVENFWEILLRTDKVMKQFRSRFSGKASPVNFFWGSFDLALTFFSGRMAPPHPGVLNESKEMMAEAYSRELCSFGFWPGQSLGEPAFYAYTYPEPQDFKNQVIKPEQAYYHPELKEFILPYNSVRTSPSPETVLFEFIESTFEAAFHLQNWDAHLYAKK